MINNFDELVVVCGLKRDQLTTIQASIRDNINLQNTKKVNELYERKRSIKNQILNYINFYEQNHNKNYLDKLINGKDFEELKIYFDNFFIKKTELLHQIQKNENYLVHLNSKLTEVLLLPNSLEFKEIIIEMQKTRFSLKMLHKKINEHDYFE